MILNQPEINRQFYQHLTLLNFSKFKLVNSRYEPKGLPLVFLSKGAMYSNDKAGVLPRLRALGSVDSPLVDAVVVDVAHLLYSCVGKLGVRTFENLFAVRKLYIVVK